MPEERKKFEKRKIEKKEKTEQKKLDERKEAVESFEEASQIMDEVEDLHLDFISEEVPEDLSDKQIQELVELDEEAEELFGNFRKSATGIFSKIRRNMISAVELTFNYDEALELISIDVWQAIALFKDYPLKSFGKGQEYFYEIHQELFRQADKAGNSDSFVKKILDYSDGLKGNFKNDLLDSASCIYRKKHQDDDQMLKKAKEFFKDYPVALFNLVDSDKEKKLPQDDYIEIVKNAFNSERSAIGEYVERFIYQRHSDCPEEVKDIFFYSLSSKGKITFLSSLGMGRDYHEIVSRADFFYNQISGLPERQKSRLLGIIVGDFKRTGFKSVNWQNVFTWGRGVLSVYDMLDVKQKNIVIKRLSELVNNMVDFSALEELVNKLPLDNQEEFLSLLEKEKNKNEEFDDELDYFLQETREKISENKKEYTENPIGFLRRISTNDGILTGINIKDFDLLIQRVKELPKEVLLANPDIALINKNDLGINDPEFITKLLKVLYKTKNPLWVLMSDYVFPNKKEQKKFIGEYLVEATNLKASDVLKIMEKFPDIEDELNLESDSSNPEMLEFILKAKSLNDRFSQTTSQAFLRIKHQVLDEVIDLDNAEDVLDEIENVFTKNNLPDIGKLFKVFEKLYPKDRINRICQERNVSPELSRAGNRRRIYLIFNDLLQIHIDSNNSSLREYLVALNDPILDRVQNIEGEINIDSDGLSEEELSKFYLVTKKINKLFIESALGKSSQAISYINLELSSADNLEKMKKFLKKLATDLKLKENQTIKERISEMFLSPLGYDNIDQVLERMEQTKLAAHERSVKYAKEAVDGKLELGEGDLIKGSSSQYFTYHLQSGLLAREYLGASSDSDATPFDIDLSMVTKKDAKASFSKILKESPSYVYGTIYGDMFFVIKDRGQFRKTAKTEEDIDTFGDGEYELFVTGSVDEERHFGVRTGMPDTEIDYLIFTKELLRDANKKFSLFAEIIRNGSYLPVVDDDGKIIFTPEMYEKMRKEVYGGVLSQNGAGFELSSQFKKDSQGELKEIIEQKKKEKEKIEKVTSVIKGVITKAIGPDKMFDSNSDSLSGAILIDSGSSGRLTNKPDNFDFDFIIRLDPPEMKLMKDIKRKCIEELDKYGAEINPLPSQENQLRMINASIEGNFDIEIDISFIEKSEIQYFESHEASQERLENIKNTQGHEVFERVLANIVLAKNILSVGGCYKKFDGGMGGIGVETWILQHGGSFWEAGQKFLEKASDKYGQLISLDRFKGQYQIIDPGQNAKNGNHDNFLDRLTKESYKRMFITLKDYFGSK